MHSYAVESCLVTLNAFGGAVWRSNVWFCGLQHRYHWDRRRLVEDAFRPFKREAVRVGITTNSAKTKYMIAGVEVPMVLARSKSWMGNVSKWWRNWYAFSHWAEYVAKILDKQPVQAIFSRSPNRSSRLSDRRRTRWMYAVDEDSGC